ncbi:glycoside hydrolase/phage tail family protein [Methylopila sp. M107]|uniref:baseplate multidomain protein megatron n=1 Tax=Methylopila sp. M107 TaxID=1101190 RepID=UPI0003779B6C|nr:glycoside hydrolase/phage tail family protein [Methylopila sp. M107]
MAVLALTAIGSAIGGSLLPGGLSLFGATLSGAAIGGAVGGLLGSAIDTALLTKTPEFFGPRLSDVKLTTSTEGAAILRVYGRMRVGGQIIWASRFTETTDKSHVGGKGAMGGGAEQTRYWYHASFAVALCEGPIDGIGRIWADGEVLDQDGLEIRLHKGGESQLPDPKIVAVEGENHAPAYRGVAYLVFEELPLSRFGNRIPQITVEVIRRPESEKPALEDLLTGVTLIPGASEFGYATDVISRSFLFLSYETENAHVDDRADLVASLDELQAVAPNIAHVSLVVAWHGTDLRLGQCRIVPKVEVDDKPTSPWEWSVSGIGRGAAELVSRVGGKPAVGGAPADTSVHQAIRELKRRGLKVMLNPFVMMDIPEGNGLTDPYGGDEQAAYPWRGRITCNPAPGRPGSPDGTAAIADRVDDFFGEAQPSDFAWDVTRSGIAYSGPNEFSYRRFILHMAEIARAAGGVDAFLIGSEMVGLTTLRDAPGSYPAVAKLRNLAGAVRAILGADVRIGYAADWSEFPPHRPNDGSNDLHFHLDPLWADEDIDFVGLDNYTPLADWRDGAGHLDRLAGWDGPYDPDYLAANIEGGEGFDWFYASRADRDAQIRTPIADTAYGEHWVFRTKDFRAWWENLHRDRPGGVRGGATSWVPQSKPIVFCELGCAAIDKGANQPNVFVDKKSSESVLPYHSNGERDELAQRAALLAQLDYWRPENGRNPESALTGKRMIDVGRRFVWTWDARPPAAFPARDDVWADAGNWRRGHWITGRLGFAGLRDVIADQCRGLEIGLDLDQLNGVVKGYALDRVMSPREAIQPLLEAFGARAVARGGDLHISNRPDSPVATLVAENLVDGGEKQAVYKLTRAQASEIPRALKLRHIDPDADYRQGSVEARRLAGEGLAVAEVSLALALPEEDAEALADSMLIEASVGRERADFVLPPSRLALEPGDLAAFEAHGRETVFRIDRIGDEYVRPVKATRADPDVRAVGARERPRRPAPERGRPVAPVFEALDLPLLDEADPPVARLAAYSKPWTSVAAYVAKPSGGYALDRTLAGAATIGALRAPLGRHASGRFDRVNAIELELGPDRALESVSEAALLQGANVAAVAGEGGAWEVLQFASAELVAPARWRLTSLLRGQFGTEDAIGDPTPAGARFVLIDGRVEFSAAPRLGPGAVLTWRAGPASRPRDDARCVERSAPMGLRALLPLSPVRLSARRVAGGAIEIAWTRRTRLGGDDFEIRDVRLGEESEGYEVEILFGGAVARTIEAATPSAVYSAAQQAVDFGGPPDEVEIAVRQISAVVGPGLPARGVFAL